MNKCHNQPYLLSVSVSVRHMSDGWDVVKNMADEVPVLMEFTVQVDIVITSK